MIAVDANLLVHAHRRDAGFHERAAELVRELAEGAAPWGICHQSLAEFYGIVTRRGLWDRPSTPEEAVDQMDAWRESPSLRILHESDGSLDLMEELAVAGSVGGGRIHDARIAACCLSHGIDELWTVDRDYSRFPRLRCRNPLAG